MIREGLKALRRELKLELEGRRQARQRAKTEASATAALQTTPDGESKLADPGTEPPVVARMMVEIRSDGSRTIARGALIDEMTGEKVAIEAEGSSPLQLAAQLAKSLISAPLAGAHLAKALGRGRKGDAGPEDS